MVYGSARGSTKEVAEFMAGRFRAHGMAVDVRTADVSPAVDGYDTVEDFVLRNLDALEAMPVWLFSVEISPTLSGPIGGWLRVVHYRHGSSSFGTCYGHATTKRSPESSRARDCHRSRSPVGVRRTVRDLCDRSAIDARIAGIGRDLSTTPAT